MPANEIKVIREKSELLEIDKFLSRSLNEGFQVEIFQMAMLEPKLAIL
jgi:Fe-S cluster assembly ATPase SufC